MMAIPPFTSPSIYNKPTYLKEKERQTRDHERIINHACRELGITRKDISDRFGIREQFIGPEEIATLWLERLRRK